MKDKILLYIISKLITRLDPEVLRYFIFKLVEKVAEVRYISSEDLESLEGKSDKVDRILN